MMYEMVKTLRDYINKPVRLQFVVSNGGQGQELAFYGKITEIHNDDRVLLFEHGKDERKRMGVTHTELNLENIIIWGIDIIDPDYQKAPTKPNGWVATIPCPKCNAPVHIVDVTKAKGADVLEDDVSFEECDHPVEDE